METTNNVLIDKWEVLFAQDEMYYITTSGNDAAFAYDKKSADLIVTAVNACKAINPDNPLNAALHLVELIDMYKQLQQKLEILINATPTSETRAQLTVLNILALLKLKQATE